MKRFELIPTDGRKSFYGKAVVEVDKGHTETKACGWLREDEHPEGILSKACPVCGYKYGTSWVYFPIPADDEAIIYKLLKEGSL